MRETTPQTRNYYNLICRYLLFGLLIFSPLARGSVHLWQQTVIILFALAMLSVLLLEKGVTNTPSFKKTPLGIALVAISGLVLISGLFSLSKTDSAEGIALYCSYIIVFYVTIHSIRTRKHQRQLVYVLVGMALLLSLIGLFKMGGGTLSFWHYPTLDGHNAFLTGVFGNHNHMAGYLEMVIPLALVLLLIRTRRGLVKAALIGLCLFLILAHLMTLSRGGWSSLGCGMGFFALVLLQHKKFRRKRMVLLLSGAAVLVAILVLSGADLFERALTLTDEKTVMGLGGRVIAWKGTFEMIQAYPFLGAGPGTYATVAPQFQAPGFTARFYQAHNDYLQYISELGYLFVPLLIWLLISYFRAGFQKMNNPSRQTWGITLGCMTGVIALLVHSFIDFNLHIPSNAVLFTVLVALTLLEAPRRKKIHRD